MDLLEVSRFPQAIYRKAAILIENGEAAGALEGLNAPAGGAADAPDPAHQSGGRDAAGNTGATWCLRSLANLALKRLSAAVKASKKRPEDRSPRAHAHSAEMGLLGDLPGEADLPLVVSVNTVIEGPVCRKIEGSGRALGNPSR